MRKGKREQETAGPKRSAGLKALALAAVLILALCCVIGGTVAWLSARTDPVVNTFTYGDINITLAETDTKLDGDSNPNTNEYKMMPGQTITKDPLVTVLNGSEDCWLFVKLEQSANFDDFMTYTIADGWTALAGQDGVYYRMVAGADEDQPFCVILDNTVTVKDEVTKDMLNGLDETPGAETYPTLTITAYAVQYDDELEAIDTAEEAWALAVQAQSAGEPGAEPDTPEEPENP